jgi:hypothetical protein
VRLFDALWDEPSAWRSGALVPTPAELAELDAKIGRALDLAIEHGDVAAVKDRLRDLKAERDRVARLHAQARMALPTADELMPLLREKLRDIGATLHADVASGRLALGALLGERQIRIYRDGRIEGAVALDALPAPSRHPKPVASVVAGERYAQISRGSRSRWGFRWRLERRRSVRLTP